MKIIILAKGVHDSDVVTFACEDPEINTEEEASIAFAKDSLDVGHEAEAIQLQEPAKGFRVMIRCGEQSRAFDVTNARLEHDGSTLVLQPEANDLASMRTFIALCQAQQASQESDGTASTVPASQSPVSMFGAPAGAAPVDGVRVPEQLYDTQGNPLPVLDRRNAGITPGEGASKEGGANPEVSAPPSPSS